jgi:hypothetical protein
VKTKAPLVVPTIRPFAQMPTILPAIDNFFFVLKIVSLERYMLEERFWRRAAAGA